MNNIYFYASLNILILRKILKNIRSWQPKKSCHLISIETRVRICEQLADNKMRADANGACTKLRVLRVVNVAEQSDGLIDGVLNGHTRDRHNTVFLRCWTVKFPPAGRR